MIGVVGAGAFGTALAVALARDGRDVMLWARDPALVAQAMPQGRYLHCPQGSHMAMVDDAAVYVTAVGETRSDDRTLLLTGPKNA